MTRGVEPRRLALSERIHRLRHSIAEAVTDEFLRRHPDWLTRYGERARLRGVEDAVFHLDFLATAVAYGGGEAFAGYATWAARMLGSRGIDPSFLSENLRQLAEVLAGHVAPNDAQELRALVDTACAAIAGLPDGDDQAADGPALMAEARGVYLQAILGGQRTAAINVALEQVQAGHAVLDVYRHLVQPAQHEVGRLWESNRISVADEHVATAMTQYVMARLYERIPLPDRFRGAAVVTGVQGELHQLGPHMIADALETDGWNVRFLGSNLPEAAILSAVREHRPEVLAVSVTMAFNLGRVASLVRLVRASVEADTPFVIVGGRAVAQAAGFWRDAGADATATDIDGLLRLTRTELPARRH